MRIIAGSCKGRKLKAPGGLATRPVLGRVREALFNVLGGVDGLVVLDLFAGTGAVGIEALSRGAASAVFVEKNHAAAGFIRHNLGPLAGQGTVVRGDVLRIIGRLARDGSRFDLVFADPPYDTGLSQKALELTAAESIVKEHGLVALTVRSTETLPETAGRLSVVFDRRYGDTRLVIYGHPAEDDAGRE